MPLSFVTWEGLNKKLVIKKDKQIKINLSEDIQNIEFFRDYDYTIKGIITSENKINPYKNIFSAGDVIPPFDFEINDKTNVHYKLKNCFITNNLETSENLNKTTQIYVGSIKKKYEDKSKPVWRVEWFLNGPGNNIFKKYMPREIKKEDLSQNKAQSQNRIFESGCWQFQIEYNNKQIDIILHNIPNRINPVWSHKIGVTYNVYDEIPKSNDRESISEILGFIIGRELINVGYTDFDSSEQIVEECFISPQVRYPMDIKKICHAPDSPPVNIHKNIENLSNLIPKYMELKEELNLNYFLYRYWTAQNLIIEIGMPIYGATLENLIQKCIKSNKLKLTKNYVSQEEFENELHVYLEKINKKLQKLEYNEKIENPSKKIYGTISNAYQMSNTDKIKVFFDYIGLEIGKIENKAINSRHRFAHGQHIKNDKQFKKEIDCAEAYKTLLNRMLLKILGFEGKYIDYYSPGFPEKKLNEPITKTDSQ